MTQWDRLSPPYATIIVDPPWPYEENFSWERARGRERMLSYSTMTVGEVAALPVADLAQPRSHLYLWTTNRFLWDARDVALGWGFTPHQVLVWCKEPTGRGPGGLYATMTEFIIVAFAAKERRKVDSLGRVVREAREAAGLSRKELHQAVRGGRWTGIVSRWEEGNCIPTEDDWRRLQATLPTLADVARPTYDPPPGETQPRIPTNWFQWPRGAHSEKPAAFLDMVEHVSPGPYVELFARQPRLGWDHWGHGYEQGGAA